MNIVCVGDCGIDLYEPGGQARPGGITANFALQARRCFDAGDTIQIIAPLGNDAAGRKIRQYLGEQDIVCHFAVTDGATPLQHINVDSRGERHFAGYEEGVLRRFRIAGPHAMLVEDADLLVTPVFEQNRDMFASVMSVSRDGMTAVDFSDFAEHPDFNLLEQHANRIDVAFFGLRTNHTEVVGALQSTAASRDIVIVVTLGADGSRAFSGLSNYQCDAVAVDKIIETTGAGDAFAAGFLSRFYSSEDIDKALSAGAAAAARVVRQLGGN